jgi:hypothetical protein
MVQVSSSYCIGGAEYRILHVVLTHLDNLPPKHLEWNAKPVLALRTEDGWRQAVLQFEYQ